MDKKIPYIELSLRNNEVGDDRDKWGKVDPIIIVKNHDGPYNVLIAWVFESRILMEGS